MVTHSVEDKLKGVEGLSTISALTHRQIVGLLERKVIELDFFNPDYPLAFSRSDRNDRRII